MTPIRVELVEAKRFIAKKHRHHDPPPGHRYTLGVEHQGRMVGVAVVGRPVAKGICKRTVVEVTRCCTDGTNNACSWLYGAAARVARELGFRAVITYTLARESGASLKAAGWWPHALEERDTEWAEGSRTDGRTQGRFSFAKRRGQKLGAKVRWLWLTGVDS